jgi:hypothetical protein
MAFKVSNGQIHTTSGLLTLEDFSLAKDDTLTIDKALQSSLSEASGRTTDVTPTQHLSRI